MQMAHAQEIITSGKYTGTYCWACDSLYVATPKNYTKKKKNFVCGFIKVRLGDLFKIGPVRSRPGPLCMGLSPTRVDHLIPLTRALVSCHWLSQKRAQGF